MLGEIVTLSDLDDIKVVDGELHVNGKPFTITMTDDQIHTVEVEFSNTGNTQLLTLFRGHLTNYWDVDKIEGFYNE